MAEGVVVLAGSVESYPQKVRAGDLVATLPGVHEVKNNLKVEPIHDFLDDAIADDIVSGLKREGLAETGEIAVDVTDGVVILSGQVPDLAASQAACSIAMDTRGVLDVINNLEMRR